MLLHPNTLLGLPFSRCTHTSRYFLSSFNITIWPFEGALWTQGIQIYIFFIVIKEKDAYIFLKKKVFSRLSIIHIFHCQKRKGCLYFFEKESIFKTFRISVRMPVRANYRYESRSIGIGTFKNFAMQYNVDISLKIQYLNIFNDVAWFPWT